MMGLQGTGANSGGNVASFVFAGAVKDDVLLRTLRGTALPESVIGTS